MPYARIANDPSELRMFKDDFIDGKAGFEGFMPEEVEQDKQYVLQAVNGVIKFVPNGWKPEPVEPEVEGTTIILSKTDSIEDNVIMLSTSSIDEHTIML